MVDPVEGQGTDAIDSLMGEVVEEGLVVVVGVPEVLVPVFAGPVVVVDDDE